MIDHDAATDRLLGQMSVFDFSRGGPVFVGRKMAPPWLANSGQIGSHALVNVTFAGGPSWIGEGGSACLRSLMISAAQSGLAAVMVRHDPENPGWRSGTGPVCMTWAYAVHLQRLENLDPGNPSPSMLGFAHDVELLNLRVLPPVEWAHNFQDVEQPDDWRESERARARELTEFLRDPTTVRGPTVKTYTPR